MTLIVEINSSNVTNKDVVVEVGHNLMVNLHFLAPKAVTFQTRLWVVDTMKDRNPNAIEFIVMPMCSIDCPVRELPEYCHKHQTNLPTWWIHTVKFF